LALASSSFAILAVAFHLLAAAPPPAQAPAQAPSSDRPASSAAENEAGEHYRKGLALFDGGDKGQALIEFQSAHALAPRAASYFMIAQCEYHLGHFKEARLHYQQALAGGAAGTAAETARQRIEAMNRRKAALVIQAAPEGVDITIEPVGAPGETQTGQAPGTFQVSAGRWKVTARRAAYKSQTREIKLDSVDTMPLFFALERSPARLEIVTDPPNATLYVRGNRARNPYVQDVEPGSYEVYAEAPTYESRSETYTLVPGERERIPFKLKYVQRSGRPELIGFWTATGAVAAGGLVLARLQTTVKDAPESLGASATVMAGAALTGGVVGALVSTATLPGYLPDNQALFRIGSAWVGAAEGATLAAAVKPTLASAWIGGGVGLAAGAVAGTVFERRAPNYGRVALIQSSAAAGLLAGALTVPALELDNREKRSASLLGGLNLGLGVGLALAYLPDQNTYGPTWQRVMLVDLAIGAGTIAGALIKIVGRCLESGGVCSFTEEIPSNLTDQQAMDKRKERDRDNRLTARFALAGGALGLVAGWFLTSSVDRYNTAPLESTPQSVSFQLPTPTLLPVTSSDGGTAFVPGLASQGRF
jgi:hypothetical protein